MTDSSRIDPIIVSHDNRILDQLTRLRIWIKIRVL